LGARGPGEITQDKRKRDHANQSDISEREKGYKEKLAASRGMLFRSNCREKGGGGGASRKGGKAGEGFLR